MEMESGSPVVSTTSSIDLLSSSKEEAPHNDADEGEQEPTTATEKADSTTMQNNEDGESKKGTAEEEDVPLIEGLPKPSSELEKVEFHRDSQNRVKLYVLCDQRQWDDKGTGHVACLPSPENNNTWCIIVRLESNERNILESKVQLETVYQKQQGTLIIWSESEAIDLALSFQEKTGCSELWEKICRIQGRDPDTDAEQEENETDEQETTQSDSRSFLGVLVKLLDIPGFSISANSAANNEGTIPPCNLHKLWELEQALSNAMFANSQREKMANAIIQNDYIPKLCELFSISEDLENKEALQQMASIAKNLFLLNNNAVLNELIDDKHFRSIVGMLEYDAAYTEPKKHREFLWERSKFREVLPISSSELKAKIHQTFRLQYVQDVCLPAPSIFEENLLTVLTSHLFFIRAEIVNSLLNDKELMHQLFSELRDSNIQPQRQRDLTNFLKEFCTFAHSLQPTGPQGREQFFKTLLANDVLSTIDPCISSTLASTRSATVELLTIIVDFNPQIFRDFLVKQFPLIPESKNDSLLINKLINHMLSDKDAEFTAAQQMSNVLRVLVDPESIVAKGEKGEFLQKFYKRAMHTLCAPITENAKDGKPINDTYYMANKIALIIDLLCFFVEHHSYNMRTYTIQKGLIQSVLVYLKTKHHFLAHCALRLLRRIIGLKDDIYIKHICDKGILDLVVDCFVANGTRYNLLNSSLIELFEYIRTEEMRPLILCTIQKHWDSTFSKVNYVDTFSRMKVRCQQYADANGTFSFGDSTESASKENLLTGLAMTPPNPQWRKEREHDDEELFFSKDEDDDMPAPQLRKSGIEPMFPSLANRKRKSTDEDDGTATVFGGSASAITPPAGTRISKNPKIIFRMSSGTGKEPPPPLVIQQSQTENETSPTKSTQKAANTAAIATPSTPSIATTTAPSSPTTTLKRPLVDYDDSDDENDGDDDDGDQEEQEGADSSSDRPKAGGVRQTKSFADILEPKKMPKLAADSSTRDPGSPPPDPEQQQSGRRGQDIH